MGVINQIGPLGWPLALLALIILAMFVKDAIALYGKGSTKGVDLAGISILGGMGLGLGAFSTLLGVYQGLQIYSHLSSEQVAAGFSQALLALLLGLFIYIVASALRYILHLRFKKIESISR